MGNFSLYQILALFRRDIKRGIDSVSPLTLRGSVNVFLWLFAFFALALSLTLVFGQSFLWPAVSLAVMVGVSRFWPLQWRASAGWRKLNDWQANNPVRIDRGEDGGPIARGKLEPVGYVDELDETLVIDDDGT